MHALEGLKAPEIGTRMDLCGATVRHWLKRFNARGLQGLEEDVRTGRPPKYSDKRASKAAFFGPVVIQPERSTSPTAAIVSSSMVGREKGRKGSSAVMGISFL